MLWVKQSFYPVDLSTWGAFSLCAFLTSSFVCSANCSALRWRARAWSWPWLMDSLRANKAFRAEDGSVMPGLRAGQPSPKILEKSGNRPSGARQQCFGSLWGTWVLPGIWLKHITLLLLFSPDHMPEKQSMRQSILAMWIVTSLTEFRSLNQNQQS